MQKFYLLFFIILIFFTSCRKRQYDNPGPSLIYLSFDREIANSGILPVNFKGDKYVSYGKGIADSCLNLSDIAAYRKPLIVDKGTTNSFSDYEGLTLMLWTKSVAEDPFEYVIVGQQNRTELDTYHGWHISKTTTGGWKWKYHNGEETLEYNPLNTHQPINDGKWHQIGFSVSKREREARFYYDGNLKAVISLENTNFSFPGTALYLGASPLANDPQRETFNGFIDETGIWSRVLSDSQVAGLYKQNSGKNLKQLPVFKDSITVMTWNIQNGGSTHGKFVGVKRIADVIKKSGADIITIQEAMGSGEHLAAELNYYLYRRSNNLNVLSRFTPVKSYNAFRPNHFGLLQVSINEDQNVFIGPLWLSSRPNLTAYFLKDNAMADTIELREMESRGREVNFMMSEIRSFINNSQTIPLILAGDFNSGSHLDWTERNKDRHHNLVVNFPATRFMTQAGFSDAYRKLYPNEVSNPGHTWSPLYKEGLQTRMDFIFFKGEKLIPSSARIIDSYQFGFPSDHAAVVASFKIENQSSSSKGSMQP